MEDLNTRKKSPAPIIAVIVLALALGLGGYSYFKKQQAAEVAPVEETTQATEETTPADTAAAPVAEEPKEPVVVETKTLDIPKAETPAPSAASTDPEIVAMMAPRSIGSATAPIKITEYSSLTCSHCGAFHREIFDKFKTEFVDTGKVQITFKEFPLNQPALDASQILRCMPEDKFVSFMSLLFQEQDKWAFETNYKDALKQNAKLAGMSDETFDKCLANTALKEAILGDMKAAGDTYKVQSTPSFVINGGQRTLVGAQPITEFEKAFAELSSTPATAPAPVATEATPAATTESPEAAAADAAATAATPEEPKTTDEAAPPAE